MYELPSNTSLTSLLEKISRAKDWPGPNAFLDGTITILGTLDGEEEVEIGRIIGVDGKLTIEEYELQGRVQPNLGELLRQSRIQYRA